MFQSFYRVTRVTVYTSMSISLFVCVCASVDVLACSLFMLRAAIM